MFWEPSVWRRYCLRGECKVHSEDGDQSRVQSLCREKIALWMEDILDDATDPWGVKVERVEM